MCAVACPEDALSFAPRLELAALLERKPRALASGELAACTVCRQPTAADSPTPPLSSTMTATPTPVPTSPTMTRTPEPTLRVIPIEDEEEEAEPVPLTSRLVPLAVCLQIVALILGLYVALRRPGREIGD
ncbi:MAG: hypothetical protein GY824_23225 [Delftia sp.]|nr:hypothetical protein [Delftia sp.]